MLSPEERQLLKQLLSNSLYNKLLRLIRERVRRPQYRPSQDDPEDKKLHEMIYRSGATDEALAIIAILTGEEEDYNE
jgi:hypothetical protein